MSQKITSIEPLLKHYISFKELLFYNYICGDFRDALKNKGFTRVKILVENHESQKKLIEKIKIIKDQI